MENQPIKTLSQPVPKRALILLTSHRSGSTWLSDAIRCHPAIEYYHTAVLYEALGIEGRRYPGDLSNQTDGVYEIEVQPGKWDKIPQFNLWDDLTPQLRSLEFEQYGIEKCHPCFFEFDPKLFLQGIQQLEELGTEVKLVYLVRDPKSLMTSFMNYQQRKPSWYKSIVGEALPQFIQQTYDCIAQVAAQRPGVILDYSNSRTDLAYTLVDIYLELWLNLSELQEELILQVSELAGKYTNRQKRLAATDSPFLGKVEGTIEGGSQDYAEFFKEHQVWVEKCYESYRKALGIKAID
ncbi:MAG: sulfotransferase [Microcoleaceae cyanobacterium]